MVKEGSDRLVKKENVSKKSSSKVKHVKKIPNLLAPEEGEGELQINTLFITTEKEIPAQVCVYKDRKGRVIIETACELTDITRNVTMTMPLPRPPAEKKEELTG